MALFELDFTSQMFVPFLFVFAVVFGVLQLVNIFKNKSVNAVISLAIAFFASSNAIFTSTLLSQMGNITTFFIAMFFIAFIMELFGFRRPADRREYQDRLIIQGGILFILLATAVLFVNQIPTLPFIGEGSNLLLLIGIIFILAVFWAAYKIGIEPPPQK